MSNNQQEQPDWRVRAFLQQYPNAKLDGFEPVPEVAPQPKEPVETPKSGSINSEQLTVLVPVAGNVHQVALSKLQRAMVLALIVKMHNGQPRLFGDPVAGLTIGTFEQPE